MNIKRFKQKLGKYKILFNRMMSYIGIVNFLMLLKVFASNEPLGFNWIIWLIFAGFICICVTLFDLLFVIEADGDYGFSKTPKFVEMYNDIKDIKERLEWLEDKK